MDKDKDKDPLIGLTLGNYVVKKLVGKGAMGKVYLGVHPEIGKEIAIKVLASHLSNIDSMSQRFIREAKTINKIEHPNIIEIFDFGVLPDRRYYYTMEYLKGNTLTTVMKNNVLKLKQILVIFREVCDALDAVHELGIVHRDLKPSNIFLSKKGRRTVVKILDFGIAKLVDLSEEAALETATGAVLGTPVYMSPEQAMGKSSEVDHLADIYSIGVIIYRMLSSELPVPGHSIGEVVTNHILKKPKPLNELIVDFPKELSDIILKAIEKEPKDRYQNAYKFYEDFEKEAKKLSPDTVFEPIDHVFETLYPDGSQRESSQASLNNSESFIGGGKKNSSFSSVIDQSKRSVSDSHVSVVENSIPPPPESMEETSMDNSIDIASSSQSSIAQDPQPAFRSNSSELSSKINALPTPLPPTENYLTGENFYYDPNRKKIVIAFSLIGAVVLVGILFLVFSSSGTKDENKTNNNIASLDDKTDKSVNIPLKKDNNAVMSDVMKSDVKKPKAMKPKVMKSKGPILHTVTLNSPIKEVIATIKIKGKPDKLVVLPAIIEVQNRSILNVVAKKTGYKTKKIKIVVIENVTQDIKLKPNKIHRRPAMKRATMRRKPMGLPDIL